MCTNISNRFHGIIKIHTKTKSGITLSRKVQKYRFIQQFYLNVHNHSSYCHHSHCSPLTHIANKKQNKNNYHNKYKFQSRVHYYYTHHNHNHTHTHNHYRSIHSVDHRTNTKQLNNNTHHRNTNTNTHTHTHTNNACNNNTIFAQAFLSLLSSHTKRRFTSSSSSSNNNDNNDNNNSTDSHKNIHNKHRNAQKSQPPLTSPVFPPEIITANHHHDSDDDSDDDSSSAAAAHIDTDVDSQHSRDGLLSDDHEEESAEDKAARTAAVKKASEKIDRRVWPIACSSFLMGSAIGVIIPVMPSFATDLGLTTVQYGAVISVMGITRLIFNIPAAWASERFGRRPLLVAGPMLSAVGMASTAMVTTMAELTAFRFMTGAGGSIQMAGAQAYLSDISTPINRARTMAPLMAAFSAGAAIGPAIGGFFADSYGLRVPFIFVGSAFTCVAINNFVMLPETKKFDFSKSSSKREKISLKREFSNTVSQWVPIISSLDNRAIFLLHMSFWFAQAGCTFTLMPLYATSVLDMSMSQIGVIFAMMSVINVIGSQPFAWIADKYGRKKVILPATLLVSSTIACIHYCTDAQSLAYLMAVYSCGSCMMGTSPTAYMADMNGDEVRTQALALLRSGGDIGLFMGSGVLGYIAYVGDYSMAFNTGSLVLLTAGLHFTLRARESITFSK